MTTITEHYSSNAYESDRAAMTARNARARELRRQGWTVTCKTWDFTDLARARDYTLEATKE